MMRALLIANRGEIACRVIRAARARGLRSIAVFSDADAGAPHTHAADLALRIGPAPVGQSYLDAAAILRAAREGGADAVHPGYGFLSENADFAAACTEAGLTFVGPPPEAIGAMGDKARAKRRMIAAGVPCVPGYEGDDQSDASLAEAAARIGLPLLLKASAGGGGRGMRLVSDMRDFAPALADARAEARDAFGSDRMLIERAITRARHVEIQVFADAHGNCLHLGERDCSTQRRHQKLIEESPVLDPALRARMGEAAARAARAVGYVGAGTVEFLLDADGAFYFLEMNTRLQVEHPVTEAVTGLDLVDLQLAVAEGARLPLTQDAVRFDGHAIEARLYAEDSRYVPQTGRIALWHAPAGVRVDHGIATGQTITQHYDAMLAKLIAHAPTREGAIARLLRALDETVLLGLMTNRDRLRAILDSDAFRAGAVTTDWLDAQASADDAPASPDLLAVAALLLVDRGDGWQPATWLAHPLLLLHGETRHRLRAARSGDAWTIEGEAFARTLRLVARGADEAVVARGEAVLRVAYAQDGDTLHLQVGGVAATLTDATYAPPVREELAAGDVVRAPIAGLVRGVGAAVGEVVAEGAVLVVLEAMKMRMPLTAPRAGIVETIAAEGDAVAARAAVARLREEGPS